MAFLQRHQDDSATLHERSNARLAVAAESRADALITDNNVPAALTAAIQAAEFYIAARRDAASPADKQLLDKKCKDVVAKAERWKKQLDQNDSQKPRPKCSVALGSPPPGPPRKRPPPKSHKTPTVSEQVLLMKSSKINGGVFPPWKAPPAPSEFPDEPFLDPSGDLKLSKSQKLILDDWKRPHEIHPDSRLFPEDGENLDLTQDVITDCSVVASLCASTRREEKGFGDTVRSIIYPQDEKGRPVISKSGKYVVKLFFNGCYRKVIIDDFLPASISGRALYTTCRKSPFVFAPALIEKAYLKIMGGYDFPGSNSGTDLLALTGWIPEHVFLQSDEIVFSALWRRMWKAWATGDVLITLGTGRITTREEVEMGLIGDHDYAVLDLKEEDGYRMMLVKNPWSEGTIWRGAPAQDDEEEDRDFDSPSEDGDDDCVSTPSSTSLPTREPLQPGAFWISLENIARNFASIYLNWNPTLFSHIHETHFPWDISTRPPETSFGRNPQFAISNPSKSFSGPVWILLSRHLPNTASPTSKNGFISLYLFEAGGKRVYLSSPSIHRTPYVDSPQTLLCVENLPAGETYTLAVSSQGLSPTSTIPHFSLAVFSLSPLAISSATEPYPYSLTIRSSWTPATAGGNACSKDYPRNPQFALTLPSAAPPRTLALLLESHTSHPLHVKLVHSAGGERVAAVTTRDILAESGEYKQHCAFACVEATIPPGRYTVVASTFEAGQTGAFELTLLTSCAGAGFVQLPAEGAGCFETVRSGRWGEGVRRLALEIDVGRFMGVWVKARSGGPVRAAIWRGGERVVTSGGFEDLPMGIRTRRVDLEWREGGYRVLLERVGGAEGEGWEVCVLSEGTLWVGEGEEEEEEAE